MPDDFGGLESFGGSPQGKEKAQESDERFQERYRQAQAAIKQIKKEEQRKKQDDNALAQIIVQFLRDPTRGQMFIMISRIIALDIPSDLVLAIISLIHEPARLLIEQKFNSDLIKIESKHEPIISKKAKIQIDDWANKMFIVCSAEPHRILETILNYEGNIQEVIVQLSVMILREYLEKSQHQETNFDNLKSFCEAIWLKIIDQINTQINYQGLLNESEKPSNQ